MKQANSAQRIRMNVKNGNLVCRYYQKLKFRRQSAASYCI